VSYYIYGLRISGDPECRYVGQTAGDPQRRLESLLSGARRMKRHRDRGYGTPLNPDGFDLWLVGNAGNIDAFKIAKVETRAEALATERAIVALVLRLEHRLYNRHLVPAEKRIDWRASELKAMA
jgi:hypothetical protein